MKQEVDFVLDEEYTDEEGNELPEEEPPRLITLNVAGCLFPHQPMSNKSMIARFRKVGLRQLIAEHRLPTTKIGNSNLIKEFNERKKCTGKPLKEKSEK